MQGDYIVIIKKKKTISVTLYDYVIWLKENTCIIRSIHIFLYICIYILHKSMLGQ